MNLIFDVHGCVPRAEEILDYPQIFFFAGFKSLAIVHDELLVCLANYFGVDIGFTRQAIRDIL